MQLIDRFLNYVQYDTQSNEETDLVPSTPGQMAFAQVLAEELKSIGLQDVSLDSNGYLMATLPANCEEDRPVVGFIAHMDTSPDMSGRKVKPQIIKNYDGKDIVLNAEDRQLLAKVIWVEAQGECFEGQQAVAEVVLNRLQLQLPSSFLLHLRMC